MKYNSRTRPGSDYTRPLSDMLPDIIGKRSKCVSQIAGAAGRTATTVKNVINRLHQKGEIHIKRWKRYETGPYVAHYLWGAGTDATRPKAQPTAVIVKRYQQSEKGKAAVRASNKRWRKSEHGREYMKTYNKGLWARKKFSTGGIAAIDPLLAAIMQPRKEL